MDNIFRQARLLQMWIFLQELYASQANYSKGRITVVRRSNLIRRSTYQISFFQTGSSPENLAKYFFTKLERRVKQKTHHSKTIFTV